MKRPDHFSALGAERNDTPAQIKQHYRKLARAYHPDKGGDPEKFMAIQLAYDVLSDPDRRRRYEETGDDGSRAKAEPGVQTLVTVVLGLVGECPDVRTNDIVTKARSFLQAEVRKIAREQNELMARAMKFRDAGKRLKGSDLLRATIDSEADRLVLDAGRVGERETEVAAALALLRECNYETDEAAFWNAFTIQTESPPCQAWHTQTTSTKGTECPDKKE